MVTLAFAQAGSVLVRPQPGRHHRRRRGPDACNTDNLPDFLVGVVNTRNLYWLALAVLSSSSSWSPGSSHSRAGHVAAAVRENENCASGSWACSRYLVKLLIFVVGGILATVVGMVYLLLQSGAVAADRSPPTSPSRSWSWWCWAASGPAGAPSSGGVLYTLLDQRLDRARPLRGHPGAARRAADPAVEPLFLLGTLFVLVVLFLPGGLAGCAQRLAARVGPGRPDREGPASRCLERAADTTDLHTLGRWTADRAMATPGRVGGRRPRRRPDLPRPGGPGDPRSRPGCSTPATGVGDRIATVTGNSSDQVVLFFACAKAGLVLAPLSWRLSPHELAVAARHRQTPPCCSSRRSSAPWPTRRCALLPLPPSRTALRPGTASRRRAPAHAPRHLAEPSAGPPHRRCATTTRC